MACASPSLSIAPCCNIHGLLNIQLFTAFKLHTLTAYCHELKSYKLNHNKPWLSLTPLKLW